MKLRQKALFIIGAALVGLNVVLYATVSLVLLGDFKKLEQQRSRQEVARALDALNDNLSNLDATAQYQAKWDDTYAFMNSKSSSNDASMTLKQDLKQANEEYVKSKLGDDSFEQLKLNLLLLIDDKGRTVFSKAFDQKDRTPTQVPQSLQQLLAANSQLLNHPHRDSHRSGIVLLPEGPVLIASRPIIPSAGTGPIRGTLIVGRFLNNDRIAELGDLTQLSLKIHNLNSSTLPPAIEKVRTALEGRHRKNLSQTEAVVRKTGRSPLNSQQNSSEIPKVAPDEPQSDDDKAITPRSKVEGSTKNTKSASKPRAQIFVQSISKTTVAGYALLEDIFGKPVLLLEVNLDRVIFQQGKASLRYLIVSLLAVGLGLSGSTLILVEKLVLSRLTVLSRNVSRIGDRGDLSMRVAIDGKDELSSLADTINGMLKALQDSQQDRQESEERYRLMAENSTDLIARRTPEGVFLYVSPACRFLLGYEPEELIGRSAYELFHPEDLSSISKSDAAVMERPVTYTVTHRYRTKDGDYVWFETTSRTVRNPTSERMQEVVAISRDITERQQTEEELRESEASIRALYQVTSASQLNFQQRLEGLIEMGCRRFGLDIGILSRIEGDRYEIVAVQCPDNEISVGDVFDLNHTYCVETLLQNEPLYFESLMVSRWHSHPTLTAFKQEAYIGTPTIVGGKVYGTLSFSSAFSLNRPFKAVDKELLKLMAQWVGGEIERQAAAEALARARDEALAATRAKSEFLATMSHEIRTPMNAVIGMTGLLLYTQLTQEQRDFVETIRSSGDALLTIINDILDFSKIESGKLDLEQHPFNLRQCVEESLDLLASKAAEKGLELAYQIDPPTPNTIVGDITRLRQILVNLLSNALKFTERGEVIVSVTAQQIPVRSSIANGKKPEKLALTSDHSTIGKQYEIQLAVQDTGIGIPLDRMDRLFKSFSQIDSSTTRHYGGTGLGLAISKRLSELMGGTMWVESQVGVGSTFYFTAIAPEVPASDLVDLGKPKPQFAGKRLLIVDDNATNLRILTKQAECWGMLAKAAASGVEALQCLGAGEAFDLAILDVQMPEMDGLTLASEIRSLPVGQELPIVMLTSLGANVSNLQGSRNSVLSLPNVQFAAFLNKPVKQSQLYNVLNGIFGGEPLPARQLMPSSVQIDSQLAERLPLRILLAEDHLVNQKVALQILQRLGYRADVAGNGLEVLQALHRQPYDVVLMDVQMPEMDGLEATRHICKQWEGAKRPRIIAMTANAMQGDRELCLEAGMDDYISKPIRMPELVQALSQCQPSEKGEAQDLALQAKQVSSELTAHSVNRRNGNLTRVSTHEPENVLSTLPIPESPTLLDARTLDSLRDIDALEEIVDLYLEEAPKLLHEITVAVARSDATALREASHSLKSTSAALGALTLSEFSKQLEYLGRSGTTTDASTIVSQVEAEYERVKVALQIEREKVAFE